MPRVMKKSGFDYKGEADFMRAYGVIRKTELFTTYNGREDSKLSSTEKRLPGVSPLVFTNFLLENASFISLADMEEGLPSYEEIPVPVMMDDELKAAYTELETKLRDTIGGRDGHGAKTMGSLLQSLSVFPDMPYNQPPVLHPDTGEVLVVPPVLERGLRNKEEELLSLVQRKIDNDEKVLVYYHWTNKTDLAEKLTNMFTENGITSAVLESKVSPDKREDWIQARVDEGVQVVICNPTLVETGLDLLDFTTIVFYQVGYNIFTMRQASRRSWRLGQEHPIEVYYIYYEDTIQEQALSLMATKLQASMAIEGKFSEEGLRAMANNEDLLTQIANSVVNGIKNSVDINTFTEITRAGTTATERPVRVRKNRRELEGKSMLSYLYKQKPKTEELTNTDKMLLKIFNEKYSMANLF
jgi:hypothetical protein